MGTAEVRGHLVTSSSRKTGFPDPAFFIDWMIFPARPDVGAPVATDLGLVAHAAERHAHELAPGGAGDRLAERGLADARGPTRQRIGPFSAPTRL